MEKVLLTLGLAALLASSYFMNQIQDNKNSDDEYKQQYNEWKSTQGRKFEGVEDNYRFTIFKSHSQFIENHNRLYDLGLETIKLGVNQFADLTTEEFEARYLTLTPAPRQGNNVFTGENFMVTADNVDWRTAGAVTPVKNQGSCGSCWAFSAVSALEGNNFLKTGQLVQLSEQELVDCAKLPDYDSDGCNGGWMDVAFQYVIDHGITTGTSYPYTGKDGVCKKNVGTRYSITSYTDVQEQSESALVAAIAQKPVSVAINAGGIWFQFYTSGVFSRACAPTLNHGVTAVGYGTSGTTPFYLVKNSWGSGWGESGYIRMVRNGDGDGECGIQDAASYPN